MEGAAERAARGELLAGTMDSWLLWKMTGGRVHVTDRSTASRTMLMNLRTQNWDEDVLRLFRIPRGILPEILDSAGLAGVTDPGMFLGLSVPVTGVMVDQQAALFGQGCLAPGMTKTTYGTGCFLLMNTGEEPVRSRHGLLTTVGWSIGGRTWYALDGGIYIAGAAVEWLRKGLRIISDSGETEAMARSARDNGDVFFVPAFAGLAAPYWDQYARGAIVGITGGTTREQIVRAALESIAYQVKDNLDAMEADSGIRVTRMRVDGGMVNNSFLMQFQSDLLGIPIDVPVISETTALGAAYMAGVGIGALRGPEEAARRWRARRVYQPAISREQREQLMERWHQALRRSMDWAQRKR